MTMVCTMINTLTMTKTKTIIFSVSSRKVRLLWPEQTNTITNIIISISIIVIINVITIISIIIISAPSASASHPRQQDYFRMGERKESTKYLPHLHLSSSPPAPHQQQHHHPLLHPPHINNNNGIIASLITFISCCSISIIITSPISVLN